MIIMFYTLQFSTLQKKNIRKTLACTLTHTQIHNGDTADAKKNWVKIYSNVVQNRTLNIKKPNI